MLLVAYSCSREASHSSHANAGIMHHARRQGARARHAQQPPACAAAVRRSLRSPPGDATRPTVPPLGVTRQAYKPVQQRAMKVLLTRALIQLGVAATLFAAPIAPAPAAPAPAPAQRRL